jgi:hypothetical protein
VLNKTQSAFGADHYSRAARGNTYLRTSLCATTLFAGDRRPRAPQPRAPGCRRGDHGFSRRPSSQPAAAVRGAECAAEASHQIPCYRCRPARPNSSSLKHPVRRDRLHVANAVHAGTAASLHQALRSPRGLRSANKQCCAGSSITACADKKYSMCAWRPINCRCCSPGEWGGCRSHHSGWLDAWSYDCAGRRCR